MHYFQVDSIKILNFPVVCYNANTRAMYGISSKVIIKTPEQRPLRRSDVTTVNFG